MASFAKLALAGGALFSAGLLLRALGRRSREGVPQASGGLTGAFTIEGVSRLVGGGEIGAIVLPSGAFSSVIPAFNGAVMNRGNALFEGQVSLIATSGGVPADVRVQNVAVAPGATGAISITVTVPQTAAPGDIVVEARLVDLGGALKGRLLSGVLGRVEAVSDVTLTGTFTV